MHIRCHAFVYIYTVLAARNQILEVLQFYFSPNRPDPDSRKQSELCSRAARQGGLLGWREWNGFTMETAGKRPEEEAIWRRAASEHVLIKRPREALGAAFLRPRRMNAERRPRV